MLVGGRPPRFNPAYAGFPLPPVIAGGAALENPQHDNPARSFRRHQTKMWNELPIISDGGILNVTPDDTYV